MYVNSGVGQTVRSLQHLSTHMLGSRVGQSITTLCD